MRSLFTALAFLVILWAVIPALRRSILPWQHERRNGQEGHHGPQVH